MATSNPRLALSGLFSGLRFVIKLQKSFRKNLKLEDFQFGSAVGNANRLVAKVGSAAHAGWHGRDGFAVPGTGAWLGGDLQTLRNAVRGTPPDLPGGERLLLPMPDGDRLAARLDRRAATRCEAARRAGAWPHRLRGERVCGGEHAASGRPGLAGLAPKPPRSPSRRARPQPGITMPGGPRIWRRPCADCRRISPGMGSYCSAIRWAAISC